MSNSAKAVIGALYGDEGKGATVDRLAASTPGAIVVRSNGGAQAGHTVVSPFGQRHVFHHLGSGSFTGAATHFSRFFVAHPMMLFGELAALERFGVRPAITSDPRALVTTPFDVIINQALELARGIDRHGSCGLGFGETIGRNLTGKFGLSTQDLFRQDLREKLVFIRDRWVPLRLATLGIRSLPPELGSALADERTLESFLEDCALYCERVSLWPDRRLTELGTVIFEAAQGLLLDQNFGAFPHVTRSNTGLANILKIAAEADIDELDVQYVARCYTTRHGAGPLKGELSKLDGLDIVDQTNAPNDWQGRLRLAPLDLNVVRNAVHRDIGLSDGTVLVRPGLVVTCLDQAKSALAVVEDDRIVRLDPINGASYIADRVELLLLNEHWRPSR